MTVALPWFLTVKRNVRIVERLRLCATLIAMRFVARYYRSNIQTKWRFCALPDGERTVIGSGWRVYEQAEHMRTVTGVHVIELSFDPRCIATMQLKMVTAVENT